MANNDTLADEIEGTVVPDGSALALPGDDEHGPQLRGVNAFLIQIKPHIADVLPKQITPERIARLLYGEVRKNPKLLKCTKESLIGSMLTTIQLGLEPGGNGGECWLLPFKNRKKVGGQWTETLEATFMLGYKGMIKLYWNHPLAMDLDMQTVREGDEFDVVYGTHKSLHFRKARLADRGDVTHYYAQAHLKTGGSPFLVLEPEEVEAFRQRSMSPNSPAWRDDYEPMAHKTCIRQLATILPRSVELAAGVAWDGAGPRLDQSEDGLTAEPPRIEASAPSDEVPAESGPDGPPDGVDASTPVVTGDEDV